eukprot:scaffold43431_cov14-Tisochrysis_lutea.AAC.1
MNVQHKQSVQTCVLQAVDTNNDQRISWDEFNRVFSAGGLQQLQVRKEQKGKGEERNESMPQPKGRVHYGEEIEQPNRGFAERRNCSVH